MILLRRIRYAMADPEPEKLSPWAVGEIIKNCKCTGAEQHRTQTHLRFERPEPLEGFHDGDETGYDLVFPIFPAADSPEE